MTICKVYHPRPGRADGISANMKFPHGTMLKTPVIRSLRACKLSSLSCYPSSNSYTALFQCTSCIKKYPRVVVAPRFFSTSHAQYLPSPPKEPALTKATIRENIYTIPNLLTVSRILACPVLGWSILDGNYHLATGLLVYAGLTDLVRAPKLSCRFQR